MVRCWIFSRRQKMPLTFRPGIFEDKEFELH